MLSISPRIIQNIVVLVALLVLVWSCLLGVRAGQDIARTSSVVRGTQTILTGLRYFYEDQSRYPSNSEFSSIARMSTYFDRFPPTFFTNEVCLTNGVYRSDTQKTFSFQFCLPRSAPPFAAGVNMVTERTVIPKE